MDDESLFAYSTLNSLTPPVKRPTNSSDKKKIQHMLYLYGGRGWIRTTEAESNRFTVCPLWPLGNSSLLYIVVKWSWRWDSNPRPADYKSAALPTELRQHNLVGMTGFEPAPLWSQTRCATKLRYIPSLNSTCLLYLVSIHFATRKTYHFQSFHQFIICFLYFSPFYCSFLLFSKN